MLPGRDQFVRLWQAVSRLTGGAGESCERLPALRRLAGAVGGAEPFLRTLVGLLVFSERGLVALEAEENRLTITPAANLRGKVDLGASPYVRRLRQILGIQEKGGV